MERDPQTETPWKETPDRDQLPFDRDPLDGEPPDRDPRTETLQTETPKTETRPNRDPPDRDPLVLTSSGSHCSGRIIVYVDFAYKEERKLKAENDYFISRGHDMYQLLHDPKFVLKAHCVV